MIQHLATDDSELLREFFLTRKEAPLRSLMSRHLPLVYSVALRISGSPELAAEAAQDVFLKLINSPAIMKKGTPFLAWLHRSARHRAIDLVRSEQARKRRERLAMENSGPGEEVLSAEALATLDEVLDQLSARDKDLVLERYFAGRSLKAIGSSLGLSEDAVRMRLARTLEKMRAGFGKRGIATSATLLAASLPLQAVVTPPATLSFGIQSTVTAAVAGSAPPISLLPSLALMSSTQKIFAAAILLLVVGTAATVYLPSATSRSTAPHPHRAHPANSPATRTHLSTVSTADERVRIDRVHGWLMDTSPESEDEQRRHPITVSQLSLSAVRQLLADPSLLVDIQGPEREDGFPNPVYPRRELLGRYLWEHYGKLAPQEALDKLQASQAPPRGHYWHGAATLIGVAKSDPALAFQFLRNLPADFDEPGMTFSMGSLMQPLVKHSRDEAFRTIPYLPPMVRKEAYLGYVAALPGDTDWPAEISRLNQELPELTKFGFDHGGVAGLMAGAWACSDPEAAFAWISEDRKNAGTGYFAAINFWLHREPSQALRWLKTWHPERVNADRIYASLLIYGGAGDIRTVDGLLELISDPAARTEAVKEAMENMGSGMQHEELRHLQNSPLLSDAAKRSIEEALLAKQTAASGR